MSSLILDSFCWIEIFSKGKKSKACEKYLESDDRVFIPSLIFYEVYKKISLKVSPEKALSVVAYFSKYETLEMDIEVALLAADLSIEHNLAMADALIYSHAKL